MCRGRVREGVVRIQFDRFREETLCLVVGPLARLVVEAAAPQVEVVGLSGGRAACFVPRRVRGETQFQRVGDQGGGLVLQREDLLGVALPLLGPDLDSGAGVGDLHADAELVAFLAHGSRKYQIGADPPSHVARIRQRVVLEGNAASRDPETLDVGETEEDLLRHPFAEVSLIPLRAPVGKRQDGDGEPALLFRRPWNRDRGGAFRRGQVLDDRPGEAESAPVHGGDPVGASAAAREDLARLADRPADRRFRHEGVVPNVPEKLFLGHHPVAVCDQEGQQFEHLGLKLAWLSGHLEAVLLGLQHKGAEVEDH